MPCHTAQEHSTGGNAWKRRLQGPAPSPVHTHRPAPSNTGEDMNHLSAQVTLPSDSSSGPCTWALEGVTASSPSRAPDSRHGDQHSSAALLTADLSGRHGACRSLGFCRRPPPSAFSPRVPGLSGSRHGLRLWYRARSQHGQTWLLPGDTAEAVSSGHWARYLPGVTRFKHTSHSDCPLWVATLLKSLSHVFRVFLARQSKAKSFLLAGSRTSLWVSHASWGPCPKATPSPPLCSLLGSLSAGQTT